MGIYNLFRYGEDFYGLSGMPASIEWDVYDFCHPTDATMLSLFSYAEVTPARTFGPPHMFFDGSNNLVMLSDDGADSGFRVDIPVNEAFSFQFTVNMPQLPTDFSDTVNNRFFVAAYNRYGKMAGVLLSENEGIALAQTGTGTLTKIVDSADLFEEGATDYVFRVTADPITNRGNIYITELDLVPIIGHQLRFTFDLMDSPVGVLDQTLVEVVGTVGDPTEIHMDCWRLASAVRMPNQRPIAVPGSDQMLTLGGYAGFDGRASYDPDPSDHVVSWWWSAIQAPDQSAVWVTGSGTTPADLTGYTNVIQGAAGDFDGVSLGDVILVGTAISTVKWVGDDYVVVIDDVYPAGVSTSWRALTQANWGGAYVDGVVRVVLDALTTPPPLPDTGDSYLVTGLAVGLWVGMEDRIATWSGAAWSFGVPDDNDIIYVIDDYDNRRYVGAFPAGRWIIDDPLPWELDHWSGRTSRIGSYRADVVGLHSMELIVRDDGSPELNSLPAEVLLNVQETSVLFGIVPDTGWIWHYLPDFWDLLADKEKVDTIWSGFAQVVAGVMLELWQHDYSKALLDIQRVFQKRWLHYTPLFEEPDYDSLPATVANGFNVADYSSSPGSDPYTYETGVALDPDINSDYLLVVGGTGYRVSRVTANAVITVDAMPTTDRPGDFRICPTVKSRGSDFNMERVAAGDTAIFEVISASGNATDVEVYVYGVRLNYLGFDDTAIAGYLGDDTYTVRFKQVRRRGGLRLNSYIVGIPILQEVINRRVVTGAPEVLYQNRDYRVEEETDLDRSVNTLRFQDYWFPSMAHGYDGDTTTDPNLFDSPGADFETLFGDVDLRGYLLELPTGRYRLYQVVSPTRLELEDDCLPPLSSAEWTVRRIDDPPDLLWGEVTYIDNRPTIEANFGRLVGFRVEDSEARTDNLDYLSAVKGLWYTYWFGPTPYNIRVGVQILLGLPFAEQSGTIVDVQSPFDSTRSRILIQDSSNPSIIRSYFYPTTLGIEDSPVTGLPYTLGDAVEQFAPLSKGADVVDWISDDDWYGVFVTSGDFYEAWKVHTFGVIVDADAFDLTNLQFVMDYVLKIKPTYTYPWFVIRAHFSEDVTVSDAATVGPAIPASPYNDYVNTWLYPTPIGWADSPWETKVNRVAPPTYDEETRWPSDRYVGPSRYMEAGNLLLTDTPGRVPDGWTGAWPEGSGTHDATRADGAHVLDDVEGGGHTIHRLDGDSFAADISTDGDMEAVGVAAWPDVPASGPSTKQKQTDPPGHVYSGLQSLEVVDTLADKGLYQDFPDIVDTGFQVAARCWVWVEDGQAHFRLRDQDGATYVAEVRKAARPVWQEVVLHVWAVSAGANEVRFEVLTGPAGGHFYLDNVELYAKAVPWDQWGLDRMYFGRTGGYTLGGSPDEVVLFQITAGVP